MATLTSSLVVRLIDQVTGPARGVGRALLGLDRAANMGFGDRLTNAIDRNNAALDRNRGRLFDAIAGAYALKRAISAPVSAAMDFESAMADVRKVVDFPTPQAFEDFKASLVELSKQVPLSVNGLAAIAAAAGQAGIAGDEIVRFTEAAAKVGVAFDISADQAGDAMAKMMTGLGLTLDEAVLLTDAMNHLSNAQASSASDILDVVRRVGASAKQYGFTATEVAAFASAMLSAGAESEVAATSFRNMGLRLTLGAAATKKQKKAFQTLGLSATKVAKAMQEDAVGTTIKVLEQISKLPKELQAAVSSEIFGNEARALGPLLTNLDLVRKSLGLVDDESKFAGSSFREFEVRAQTFANAVQTFENRITALKIVIGNILIPVLNDLMEAMTPIVEKISDLAAAYPDVTRNVLAAAAGLVAFRIGLIGLRFVGLLGRGGALALLAGGFRAVTFAGRPLAGFFQTLSVRARIATAATGRAPGIFARLGDATMVLGRGLLKFPVGIVNTIGNGLARLGWWGAAAAAAGLLIYNNWSGIGEFFKGFGEAFRKGIEPIQPALDSLRTMFEGMQPVIDVVKGALQPIIAPFQTLSDLLGPMAGYLTASDEAWRGWGETLGGSVATAVNTVVSAIKSVIEVISQAIGLAREMGAAISNALSAGSSVNRPTGSNSVAPFSPPPPPGMVRGGPFPHRASGGPVWPGGSFLVGENEPEVFTPKTGGEITPLSKAGGGLSVGQIGPFHITGGGDPVEVGRQAARAVEDSLRKLLRGAHADMPVRS